MILSFCSFSTHKNSRSITIKFDHLKQKFLVTYPPYISIKKAQETVLKSAKLLEEKITQYKQTNQLIPGEYIPILGEPMLLEHIPKKNPFIESTKNSIKIHCQEKSFTKHLKNYLYQTLNDYLTCLSQYQQNLLKINIKTVIKIKELKSRWGSCSSSHNIVFSWRLIFAPLEVVDYICAHETSHLIEMNHSHRFWQQVSNICPNYKDQKKWLKEQGHTLFFYR